MKHSLVYMYYTRPGYRTSTVAKNTAYYIQMFTVTAFTLTVFLHGDLHFSTTTRLYDARHSNRLIALIYICTTNGYSGTW